MLDKLPIEILKLVLQDVGEIRDLANLSQASKSLHRILVPILNEKIIVHARETLLGHWEIPPLMKTYFRDDGSTDKVNSLAFVKDLQLVASIDWVRRRRCYEGNFTDYGFPDEESESSNKIHHSMVMENLTNGFNDTFLNLPKDRLRSFTWGLGCCIPGGLIGLEGYLTNNQHRIQSLSLLRDGTSSQPERDCHGLLELKQLRHLSWKGLDPQSKSTILRELLEANCKHLESLELETVAKSKSVLHVHSFTGHRVETENAIHFPALRHLSLSHISLKSAFKRMQVSFPLEELRSLRLRNCPHGLYFVDKLAKAFTAFKGSKASKASKPLKIRCFEIVYSEVPGDEKYDGVHPLERSLKGFRGLEELYISLRDLRVPFKDFHRAIFRHKYTLKRLAHYERGPDTVRRSERFGQIRDCPTPWFRSIDDMLLEMMLVDCLGVCIPPLYLKEKFKTTANFETFKLFHLRITARQYASRDLLRELKAAGFSSDDGVITSGDSTRMPGPNNSIGMSLECKEFMDMEDLLEFVQWAFGPKGFPKLLVLAYGDFSHQTRFKWSQLLFCRVDPAQVSQSSTAAPGVQPATFRIMTKEDEYLWDRIEGGREMLSACPTEQTFDCSSSDDEFNESFSDSSDDDDDFSDYDEDEGFDDESDESDEFDEDLEFLRARANTLNRSIKT